MALTPRAAAHQRTVERITDFGLTQLDEGGTEALNLRAIARELGIVSSGIYRYVPDRSALITLLLVHCFDSLARAVEDGDDPCASPRNRLIEVGLHMREWALRTPRRWALMYGTPIIGFHAVAADTGEVGTRVISRVVEIIAAGAPTPAPLEPRDALFDADLTAIRAELGKPFSLDITELALAAWIQILGLINAEAFGHLGPNTLTDGTALLTRSLERICDQLEI